MSLGFRYPLRMCSNSRGHCRFTGHWFIRKVRPLFIASPNFTALNMGPYAPMTETVPPLRTEMRVAGNLNGARFTGSTMLMAGGGLCVGVSKAALTAANAAVGDEVQLSITATSS